MSSSEPDHVARNIEEWTRNNAAYTDAAASEAWNAPEIHWGAFRWPEAEIGVLGDVAGLDVCELGCGTAYFSAWLAQRGARPVGVDVTPAQLATARRLQAETGITFTLVEANAEDVPLPDASFDLVLSEHGASTWCDPQRWIPEAARLLRPGGRLVFMHATPLIMMCWPNVGPPTPTLLRSYFDLRRVEWEGEIGVSFQLTYGEWIAVLCSNGLAVERLVELRAPDGATEHEFYDDFSPEWSRQWPPEQIWVARKA
jgi:SAM-dependent methyltransferase